VSSPRAPVAYDNFPDLPAQAIEFFAPSNAYKDKNSKRPRATLEFAYHIGMSGAELRKTEQYHEAGEQGASPR
jgi:hypothetical protein